MTKRPWVIHPFLLAAFPTLYLYSKNLWTVDGSDVLIPIGLSLLAAVVGFAGLRACRFDGPSAGLIVSTALVLFFSFSHGVRLTERIGIGRDRSTREASILVAEGLVLASVVGVSLKTTNLARVVNDGCNASSLALVGMTVAAIVFPMGDLPATPDPVPDEPVTIAPRAASTHRPDVYLVVLDAYGRSDVLERMYGFDNSRFLDRLEQRGFVVARSSVANYCQTALSLAATLNLRYLNELAGDPSHDRRPLARLIAENATFRAFRSAGYRLVTFASGFDATESFDADLEVAPAGHLRSFEAMIADQTPLWLLLGQREGRDPHRRHRQRTLKVFDELPASSHPADRPTLTFAHVVAPHPPFVFRAEGDDASVGERSYTLADSEGWCELPGHGGPDDYARRYAEQAAYVTSRVEQVVDRILAMSSNPPVIVLMGDHGPGSRFDSAADQPNDVVERFGILNACYLPGSGRDRIGPSTTPINTLRAVLDECLGTGLGSISDRSFYSSYARPYAFVEVTADLR